MVLVAACCTAQLWVLKGYCSLLVGWWYLSYPAAVDLPSQAEIPQKFPHRRMLFQKMG